MTNSIAATYRRGKELGALRWIPERIGWQQGDIWYSGGGCRADCDDSENGCAQTRSSASWRTLEGTARVATERRATLERR